MMPVFHVCMNQSATPPSRLIRAMSPTSMIITTRATTPFKNSFPIRFNILHTSNCYFFGDIITFILFYYTTFNNKMQIYYVYIVIFIISTIPNTKNIVDTRYFSIYDFNMICYLYLLSLIVWLTSHIFCSFSRICIII